MYKKKLLYLSLAACMMGITPNVNLHAEEKTAIVQDQAQPESSTEITESPTNDTHVEESTTETTTHQKHETHKKETHKDKKKKKEKPFLHGKSGLDSTNPVIVVINIASTVPATVTKVVTPYAESTASGLLNTIL